MSKKYCIMDLFSGCGGMSDGFLKTNRFIEVAAVEWSKPQVDTLRTRLSTHWNIKDADKKVIHFDIQRNGQLFDKFDGDDKYEPHMGLDELVKQYGNNGTVDVVIGGPPCQAYSLAGRIRDEHAMQNDYRNFLFEHYLVIVQRYKPKVFVFENVPGLMSANVKGKIILDEIRNGFKKIGYEIITDVRKHALLDISEYGIPQNRKRVILFGVRSDLFSDCQVALADFYDKLLPTYKTIKSSVRESIGDLPKIEPLFDVESHKNKKSYKVPKCDITWHIARYHNIRDMETFRLLAEDLESGKGKYTTAKQLCQLYKDRVGVKSESSIHRYHVLAPEQPSTTIVAHLYKDGLRYIHYDPKQARSITVREAARLQSFDDNFDFKGSQIHAYQMIGNAVPPKFAECLAKAVYDFFQKYIKETE